MTVHPFLDPTFQVRWSLHTAEHIAPDVELALTRAEAAIQTIATQDPGNLTYDSTFLALERATEELNFAWGKVTHLQSVADSPALREAHNVMLPKVSAFFAKIPLNAALWSRLKALAASVEGHSFKGIHARLIEETSASFRLAGADLPELQCVRLEALQSELAQLTQKYSENVLDATNAWQLLVEDESRLAGLPEHAKAAARANAERKGLGSPEKPVWRFTLQGPSMVPVMTYAENEELRREVWSASVSVGSSAPHENAGLVRRILELRAEKASLLGKSHFADLVLERRMAKSGARALAFVEDLKARADAPFARECRELEEFKARKTGAPAGPLKAWEVSFWAERLRKDRYDFDEEALRPYFPMDRVISGLFEIADRVLGLTIVERPAGSVETWHPEVKYYELFDRRKRHLGSFYADWYPRESKRGGAWMGYLLTGGPTPSGGREPHLGYICGNLTPPIGDRQALLTHREVETIFHEFGHLLHHLLGEVEIKSLNGVNVAWDFVELPSQIMENWTWERAGLDLFARHHETGDPIPEALFAKMIAARRFRGAAEVMRQIQLGKMDLILHVRTGEFLEGDLEAKARAVVADCMIPTVPPGRTILFRFNHLFSDPIGYAAGYYSYKWAEVLDADAFTRFQKEGVFNPETGAAFVEQILSKGNSADPAELYRAFMGRDPDLSALLARSGLVAA
ncbi:MAG: M3 family metallopeptidase [Opitutaceae bacterium]|nr:M3 family metallopeptidase [Opitutaceae bacterium]